jgi:O-antigen/teichoic acid export membrane protein
MAGDPFIMWFLGAGGGLIGIVLIAAGLFAVQAIFTFMLWRKGDENYLFKFIVYAVAATGLVVGAITYIIGVIQEDLTSGALTGGIAVFVIMACVAGGLEIFFFIRDTWLRKEAKA